MRPPSIVWFEKLYLAGVAIGFLNLALNYAEIRERAIALNTSPAGSLIGAVVGLAINGLFWFFIARRASNATKWILVVLTAIGMVGILAMLPLLASYGPVYATLTAVVTVLQLAAVTCLFRRDAAVWLKSGGRHGPVDAATFE